MTFLLLTACMLLCFSPQVMKAASDAAAVFFAGVLPALFPMMVLNGLSLALPQGAARSLRGEAAAAVAFAFAAGSPASAQRLQALCPRRRFSCPARYGLAAATGVMSPLFIVGSLAKATGAAHAARLALAAHWGGALLAGATVYVVLKARAKRQPAALSQVKANGQSRSSDRPSPALRPMPCAEKAPASRVSLAAALPQAVSGAAQSLLAVCGAMMLFSVAAAVLQAVLAALLPQWTAANQPTLAVLWALTEIGGGAFAVIRAFPLPPWPLLCALCSFGGLSIWLQNLLFLSEEIRPVRLLLLRGLHGAFSYGLCVALFRVFPQAGAASGGLPGPLLPVTPGFSPVLPALLLLSALPRLWKAPP